MKINSSILITGAGSGIGRAIAITFAKQKTEVSLILAGRDQKKLAETLSFIPDRSKHDIISLDMTRIETIREMKKHLIQKRITLKGMILNAGIGGENHYGEKDR